MEHYGRRPRFGRNVNLNTEYIMKITDILYRITPMAALSALLTFLVGCSQDEETVDGKVPVEIKVLAEKEDTAATRVDYNTWENNDMIGIFAEDVAGNLTYSNVPYSFNAGNGDWVDYWAAAGSERIFFNDADTVTFSAYYPYMETLPEDGIIAKTITSADQKYENLPKIDYMFATGAKASVTAPIVNFTGSNCFKHCMSRIAIHFNIFDMANPSVKKVGLCRIRGLVMDGTFNTRTGVAKADSSVGPSDLLLDFSDVNLPPEPSMEFDYEIIVYPQLIGPEGFTIFLNYNGVMYYADFGHNLMLESGKKYTLDFNINT